MPSAEEVATYRKTQAALVRSDFVLNAALRNAKASEIVRGQTDAVAWLAARLFADYPDGGSVLRVGVTGVAPHDAAILANAVVEAYMNEVVQEDVRAMLDRRRKLEDSQAELKRVLDSRRHELHQLASTAGVPPDRADHRSLLSSLYQERTGLRVELARVRTLPENEACPEPAGREKLLREELTALDARIRSCEQASLDVVRVEVTRLEESATSISAEIIRLQLDMNMPCRVRLLALAITP